MRSEERIEKVVSLQNSLHVLTKLKEYPEATQRIAGISISNPLLSVRSL